MTGVQTCALPICFPVTISIDEKEGYRRESRAYGISGKGGGVL